MKNNVRNTIETWAARVASSMMVSFTDGNVSSNGSSLYSYSLKIAHVPQPMLKVEGERPVAWVYAHGSTVTTNKHRGMVRTGLRKAGFIVIEDDSREGRYACSPPEDDDRDAWCKLAATAWEKWETLRARDEALAAERAEEARKAAMPKPGANKALRGRK